MHDSNSIHHFGENDIVIPITVLEELDNFKKGNESLNFHAREFARTVDSLSSDMLFGDGVSIGPGLGRICIRMEGQFDEKLAANFTEKKPDHQILNTASSCMEHPERLTILVTKDVNLRKS